MIPIKGGTGRKVSMKDLIADLPENARIVYIDPAEDYERLKHIQVVSPANPLDITCRAQLEEGIKNEK